LISKDYGGFIAMEAQKNTSCWQAKLASLNAFLAIVCLAQCAHSDPFRTNAIRQAQRPEDTAAAYKLIFKNAGPAAIGQLRFASDIGVALQSAWEVGVGQPGEKEGSLAKPFVHRFLGLVEGRLKTRIPRWWEEALQESHVFNRNHMYFPLSTKYKYLPSAIDLEIASDMAVEIDRDRVIIRHNDRSIRIARDVFDSIIRRCKSIQPSQLSVCIHKEQTVLALHSESGFPYKLFCLDSVAGELLWATNVWGVNRPNAEGLRYHYVSMVVQDGELIVFGAECSGIYIESFNVATGSNIFRFSSTLWFCRDT
jgi:hypothetical protein